MTTLPVPPARRPWRPDRSWLLLAAPFVAASWLPWWGVLAFFLVLLLIRFDQAAEVVRVPLLLLAAGVTLIPLLGRVANPDESFVAALLAYGALFLPVVVTALLMHFALGMLEVGRSAGIAWLALLLLPGILGLAPSPVFGLPAGLGLGLLALLLCALGSKGREERPARRLTGSGRAIWNAALVGAVLAGALTLGTLALGPAGGGERGASSSTPPVEQSRGTPDRDAQSPSGEGAQPTNEPPGGAVVTRWSSNGAQFPGTDLAFLGGSLLLLAMVFFFWRVSAVRAGPVTTRFHWWEIAAVVGIVLMGVMMLVYGLSPIVTAALAGTGEASGGGPGAMGETIVLEETLPPWFAPFAHWVNRILFVIVLLFAVAVFIFAWKLRRSTDDDLQVELSADEAAAAAQPEALHRVRLAYRSAQSALGAAGLGRGPSETPAEHAARASLNLPDLAAPLGTLVTAYAPVRYGGRVTEEDAASAEAAARDITALSAEYRPLKLPDAPAGSDSHTAPSQETP
ncbi:DUF4129 domain-containing protein [Deinococcus sp. MIMF12]|uniref:DUF4129 domain-containing protein n=1 Tax=Deinococcus rhizophilus TaxID=3049544 RepID=A0ABT7JHF0_9DEIO|nr:DUF4129 domain-containing protein [Deinococcus rhizophilus]MDL2343925.1 DUF4129 domain-containing protein [Deinococcus rhizophilus]